MNNKSYCVYMHKFPNGKVYIGITSQAAHERWRNGEGYKAQLVHRAIEKYGWENIEHIVLAVDLDKSTAEETEIQLIKQFASNNPEFGYNVANGGNCPGTHSEETRQKIAESNRTRIVTDETRRKQSIAHSGVKMSDEQKEKIRQAMQGRPVSQETRDKMSKALQGREITPEARAKISASRKGKAVQFTNTQERSAKLATAMAKRNAENPEIHKKMLEAAAQKCRKKVVQKNADGSIVAMWESGAEIEKVLGIRRAYISRACHNPGKLLCGYLWEFA